MVSPVQAVDIEDFGDPNQGRQVVEGVVDKQKEPKVDLDSGSPVSRHLPARPGRVVGFAIAVLVR